MTTATPPPTTGPDDRWFVHGAPADTDDFVYFAFHYAGTGAASSFGHWPRRVGGAVLCALQPPGREDRIAEEPVSTIAEYAERAVGAMAPHLDRPFGFVGHCGAVTYMTQTVRRLQTADLPLPRCLIASSWGAPQERYFGRLNTGDLARIDVPAELDEICRARLGHPLDPGMAEIAAETLATDLRLQRTFPLGWSERLPMPVVVIGWQDDEVVPPKEVWPSAWRNCADATYHLLEGNHWSFLDCPPALRELLADQVACAAR